VKSELLHLVAFLVICLISLWRANLPDFFEKDIFIRAEVIGDVVCEEKRCLTRIRILESEIEDLEGRKALLQVYGYFPKEAQRVSLLGDIRVKNNRVSVYVSRDDIEIEISSTGLRQLLLEKYRENSKGHSTALGTSFLFGEARDLLPSSLQRSFLETGLIHLLVVSGLHVGTLALIIVKLLPAFWGLRFSLIGVLVYSALIVPQEPPVLRASLMFILMILAHLSFSRPNTFSILLFSGSLILLLFPWYVFSYSFWLSFIATAYIVLMIRDLKTSNTVKGLSASAAAFSGVAPLISTFSYISPLSVLFTPLLAPLIFFYSLMGFLSLLTFMSFSPFIDLFDFVGELFIKSVEFAENLSFQLYPLISMHEAVFLSVFGLVTLYFLKGYFKFIPLSLINLWLIVKAL